MTRRQFATLANIISRTADHTERKRLANAVADMCQAENPAFNRDFFIEACGISMG